MHLAELCLNGAEISTVRKHSMENETMKTARKSGFVKIKKKMCGNEGSCAAVGSGR